MNTKQQCFQLQTDVKHQIDWLRRNRRIDSEEKRLLKSAELSEGSFEKVA
jgi:hypothetical protein